MQVAGSQTSGRTERKAVPQADKPAPLRIAMVVHAYYEGDARVRRYAESLVDLGHEVEVFALRRPGNGAQDEIAGVRLSRLPLARKRAGVLRYFLEYLWFAVLASLALTGGMIRKGGRSSRGYDLIHVHNMPDFLVFATLVPRLFGVKVLLDVHDLMPEVYASKFKTSLGNPSIWLIRLQEFLAYRYASRVAFATDGFRDRAVARKSVRKKHTIVVMNAADTGVFNRQRNPWCGPEEDGAFHMLYVGTVSHRHGVDQCVRVLEKIRPEIPGARLILHPRLAEAEGSPLTELVALAEELGVRDMVEIRDPMPLSDVPAAMARCSVGVFTPHRDIHIDGALSLKVPEFIAMGVPVVTVRTPIMESLFRSDEVLFFEEDDMDAFADHLLRLHRDPEFGRQLAHRADRFLSEHSWEREFEGYTACIAELCPAK